MSYKIAIASGKGGTGKTTVSLNLFHYFINHFDHKVRLVDCDVEEPNDAIFFPDAGKTTVENSFQLIPEINQSSCSFCRKCVEYCEFNAITVLPAIKFAEVNTELCHSCGACQLICPENAISEKKESIGTITDYSVNGSHSILEGKLRIGSVMQTMLIHKLKKKSLDNYDIVIYDAPPGTSCPVVATINDANFIILVAEPTPFGLNDLKLMTDLLEEINIPFGVIINKSGIGNKDTYKFLEDKNIEILGEIPFMLEYAGSYSSGNLFEDIPAEILKPYDNLTTYLEKRINEHERNNHS